MASWFEQHWQTVLLAGGVAAVGVYLIEKNAAAAPATTAAGALPASTVVNLQPGATAVAVAMNGSISLVLPTGATWASSNPITPIAAGAPAPNGSIYVVTVGTAPGAVTASWVDSSGNAQTTTVNFSVG